MQKALQLGAEIALQVSAVLMVAVLVMVAYLVMGGYRALRRQWRRRRDVRRTLAAAGWSRRDQPVYTTPYARGLPSNSNQTTYGRRMKRNDAAHRYAAVDRRRC